MAKTIKIDQLANEITNTMKAYTDDVSRGIERCVDDVADRVLEEVKTSHPYTDRTGEYTKGFGKTKKDRGSKYKRIIWNRKHYQRVHLLEFGHAKVGGGRVRAFPHLRPAYEKHGAKLPDEIKKVVKRGG